MQRKQLTLVIVSLLVVVLSVSLAWFTTQIIGKGKDVSVTSTNLQIVFTDTDGEIAGADIEPGWQKTKTFTVENNSKSEYKYNIVIKDLLNTFVTNGYLKYKITSTNNGYNMTEFKDIPKSSVATDTILAYSVSIPVGVTQSYTIEFKYTNDESVDQSDDMGKKLSGTLFITEGTEDPSLATLIKANAVNENGYRYEGSDPNNYIQMEKTDGTKETWRIIGLFPDGVNGEEVIRVRRHYEQGRFPTGAFDLNGNLWQDSTLYTNLKNDYNTSNYSGTVKFKMYLGTSSSFESYTSSDLYNMERLLNSKGTASSYANGVTSYVGEVGLIYPSDYGYAAQASDCLRIVKPNSYGSNSTCYTKNWLYQGSSTLQWIISPEYYTKYSVITIYTDGNLTEYNDSYDYLTPGDNGAYSPVMALKADVTVTGSGTQSDPYVMN